MCAEARGARRVFPPSILHPIALKQALSLNQKPPQQVPSIYLFQLPRPGITGISSFKGGDKDSNSGLSACTASALTHGIISSALICLYLSYTK